MVYHLVVTPEDVSKEAPIIALPHPHNPKQQLKLLLSENKEKLYQLRPIRLGLSKEAQTPDGEPLYVKSLMSSDDHVVGAGEPMIHMALPYDLTFSLCSVSEADTPSTEEKPRYRPTTELQAYLSQTYSPNWAKIPLPLFTKALNKISTQVTEAGDEYFSLDFEHVKLFLKDTVERISANLPPTLKRLGADNEDTRLVLAADLLRSEISKNAFAGIRELFITHYDKYLASKRATKVVTDPNSILGSNPTKANKVVKPVSKKTKDNKKTKVTRGAIDSFFTKKK